MLSREHGISSRGRQGLRGVGAAADARGAAAGEGTEPVGSGAPRRRASAVGEPVGGRVARPGAGRARAKSRDGGGSIKTGWSATKSGGHGRGNRSPACGGEPGGSI